MLADPCADPGIVARVVQARLPENSSDNGFCPQILQFYSGLSMVYFKENYNFTRFRGGGGPFWRKWVLYSTLNVHVIQHWSMFVRLMQKNASLCGLFCHRLPGALLR